MFYSRLCPSTATGALANLKVIWKDKNIALDTKIRLLRSLIMSIFLYACEAWTLTAETERKVQTMEMRSFRRLLASPWHLIQRTHYERRGLK